MVDTKISTFRILNCVYLYKYNFDERSFQMKTAYTIINYCDIFTYKHLINSNIIILTTSVNASLLTNES